MNTRKAPEFQLPDQDGKIRSLTEFLKNGPVVVVFYPGDFTPVCTAQLCSYRDSSPELKNLGIQIVGISNDPPEKHKKFIAEYGFDFPLLTDADKQVAKAFGATSKWMLGAVTRANFIVNSKGDIVFEHIDAIAVTHQKSENLKQTIQRLKDERKI